MKSSTVPLGPSRVPRVWAAVAIAAALGWAASPAFAQDHRDSGGHQDYGHQDNGHQDNGDRHNGRRVERPVVHQVVRRDYRSGGYDGYYYQEPVYAPPVVYAPEPPSVGVNLIIPFHF